MEFTLKDIDDYDIDVNSKRFNEMCKLIDNMNEYSYENAYLMEVVKADDKKTTITRAVKDNFDKTKSTTAAAFGAANKVAKSLGSLYANMYKIAMRCISFIASSISFILDAITLIPKHIDRCLSKIGSLVDSVVAKIRGDIMLYITHTDIPELYTNTFINYLLEFKQISEMLLDDKIWDITQQVFYTKMFGYKVANQHSVAVNMKGLSNSLYNQGIIPKLEELNSRLKNAKFIRSKIDMSLPGNRSIYLKHPKSNSDRIIKITYKGKTTYYAYYLDAMKRLIDDVSVIKDDLTRIQESVGNKISQTAYQNFANLPADLQKLLQTIMVYIASVCKRTAMLITTIQKDVKTIENAVDKLLASQNSNENIENNANINSEESQGEN